MVGRAVQDREATIKTESCEEVRKFIVTAYCNENYPHICNDGDNRYTATMTTPTVGRTIAVDPNIIPYGTEVVIDSHTYVAEDTGESIKGNRIDLLFDTHEEALEFGVQEKNVIIKRSGDNG